jgi:hypothetical protein
MKQTKLAPKNQVSTPHSLGPLNLDLLYQMHPRLPADMARVMVSRAALGLGRHQHVSGVNLSLEVDVIAFGCPLLWSPTNPAEECQHDSNRITEDGAEAVALAAAHVAKEWQVVRRLQQGEHADWLLEYKAEGKRQLIAFEISGVDSGGIQSRLNTKLKQAGKSSDFDLQYAGVVGFEKPEASLQSAAGRNP